MELFLYRAFPLAVFLTKNPPPRGGFHASVIVTMKDSSSFSVFYVYNYQLGTVKDEPFNSGGTSASDETRLSSGTNVPVNMKGPPYMPLKEFGTITQPLVSSEAVATAKVGKRKVVITTRR